MGKKDNRPEQADPLANTRQALRLRAEEMAHSPEDPKAMSPEETQQTLHELRVHQIELEMQNEELKRVQAELDAARARYFDLYDLAPVSYCTISEKGLIMEANLAAANLLGVARGALTKQPISRFILKEDQDIYYLHRKQLFEIGEPQACELRMVKMDGTVFWAHLVDITLQDADGAPVCRVVLNDITDRKQAENTLKESENRLIAAQQMAHVGNWELNLDTKNIWASEEFFNIYGIEYISQYLPLDTVEECVFPEYRELLDAKLIGLISKKEKYDAEFKIKNAKTGQEHFVHSKAELLVDEKGNASKVVGTIQNITEHKKKEEEILYLSYHDQLTGLYNRRFYEEELKRLDTKRNLPMTIAMGDVNGLKLVNDSFGHIMGDELLKKAAEVIKKVCRADDIIARLGGDEFVIILPKANGFGAEQVIKRIKDLASKEKVGSLDISISFGYGTKTNEEENIQEVSKNAEDHMYKHKIYESLSTRSKTIDLIMNTLYEKSNREMLHSKRVSKICEDIATKMNFDKDDVNKIRIAGLMHDIGKIGIDEKILNKPKKLNSDDWTEIKRHSEIGYRILSSVNEFSEIADYVLEHQEYWNGKGYPRGLEGEEISIQARIIAVADAFDAMTTNRTYGKALSEEEAMNEIRRCSGTQFDPTIARVFIEKVLGERVRIV